MTTISNRQLLKERSRLAKDVQALNPDLTINEILISSYLDDDNKEFKTFNGWLKEGFRVRKGSKAFLIWGKKRKATDHTKDTEKDEFSFFPLAFIFSNAQVEPLTQKASA